MNLNRDLAAAKKKRYDFGKYLLITLLHSNSINSRYIIGFNNV